MRKFSVVGLILILLSCSKDDASLTAVDVTIIDFLETTNVDSATADASGIYYYPIVENPGGTAIGAESVVSIYYTLSDLGGNVIASYQRSDGDSLMLKQGVSAVYPVGLDLGLAFMREGETFNIIVPPSLGYQDLTSGAIDQSLISLFQIEVVNVQDESSVFTQEATDVNNYVIAQNLNDTIANPLNTVTTFTSGVAYKRIIKGFGPLAVNGETIVLNYDAFYLDNNVFDSKNSFEYILGSNEPRPLVPGFEFGLTIMQPNEQALFIVPSSQGYRESALVIPSSIIADLIEDAIIPDYVLTIPPYTTIAFDVIRFD